jgi:protocatechuate 3,4-dioxygenase alpha subunit
MSLQATTWQTVGPYFRIGLEYLDTFDLAPAGTAGERIAVEGSVLDGEGNPVPDAVIEIWQANSNGEYACAAGAAVDAPSAAFTGFGRIPTDNEGKFRFTTIRPGQVPGPGGVMQAPHLAVRVMMRGLLKSLVTRMYFPSEAIASDPILQLVPEQRRETLIATLDASRESTLLWNIELQGANETVFFDC